MPSLDLGPRGGQAESHAAEGLFPIRAFDSTYTYFPADSFLQSLLDLAF